MPTWWPIATNTSPDDRCLTASENTLMAATRSVRCSAKAAWPRSTAPWTRPSVATWCSKNRILRSPVTWTHSTDALESMRRKVKTDPPLVRRLRPDAPLSLEVIVYRALRRRPEQRYASMADMAHDLAHLEQVVVPDKYERDEPPPAPVGDLPPWRTPVPHHDNRVWSACPGGHRRTATPPRHRTLTL